MKPKKEIKRIQIEKEVKSFLFIDDMIQYGKVCKNSTKNPLISDKQFQRKIRMKNQHTIINTATHDGIHQ
jgi:hypothetical protein